MKDERIQIRGNKDGINAIIDNEKFSSFEEVTNVLVSMLSVSKAFYKNSIVKITSNFKNVTEDEIIFLKEELFKSIHIKDCIFEDIRDIIQEQSIFSGIVEGRTKFIKNTVRSGQIIDYPGNIVVIGDINNGAEVNAAGNIIVLGSIKGRVRCGIGGSDQAIIAAFSLQPEILQIGDIMTISPDDLEKPPYPEMAKIRDGIIIVEPYLPNKYI